MYPSSQLACSIEGTQTELLIQSFADRILVLITQVGKVGNLIQATIPPTAPLVTSSNPYEADSRDAAVTSDSMNSLPPSPPSIQLTPLLGSAPTEQTQTLHTLYASQVATLIWLAEESRGGERKPIIVGIALKKTDTWDEVKQHKTFIGVMQMVKELLSSTSS